MSDVYWVQGAVLPDCTGRYIRNGVFNGAAAWEKDDGRYWIWYESSAGYWMLSSLPGKVSPSYWWSVVPEAHSEPPGPDGSMMSAGHPFHGEAIISRLRPESSTSEFFLKAQKTMDTSKWLSQNGFGIRPMPSPRALAAETPSVGIQLVLGDGSPAWFKDGERSEPEHVAPWGTSSEHATDTLYDFLRGNLIAESIDGPFIEVPS